MVFKKTCTFNVDIDDRVERWKITFPSDKEPRDYVKEVVRRDSRQIFTRFTDYVLRDSKNARINDYEELDDEDEYYFALPL